MIVDSTLLSFGKCSLQWLIHYHSSFRLILFVGLNAWFFSMWKSIMQIFAKVGLSLEFRSWKFWSMHHFFSLKILVPKITYFFEKFGPVLVLLLSCFLRLRYSYISDPWLHHKILSDLLKVSFGGGEHLFWLASLVLKILY